ncbi:MAG: 3-phosphoshikimate 1-carboxyvinyltransferase [Rhodospirillaceae bacterium]|jgi:3-phosphoshikimate 1-carboxyvinyltransferase
MPSEPQPLISRKSAPLTGSVSLPGDKSISHRALILGASAVGRSRVTGLLEAEDVMATADALRQLGIPIECSDAGGKRAWLIDGRGAGGLIEAQNVLDLGNSGTGSRLLMGLLATQPIKSVITGDDSLRRRPMNRVMTPLEQFGAGFDSRDGGLLPVTVSGTAHPIPITYELPVASAQVKSAVLLAALNTPGKTTVIEPQPTRDHTEKMLRYFGAEIDVEDLSGGGRAITLTGQPELTGKEIPVPADISSAAFPLVAALLAPGSSVTLKNVGLNLLRTGLLDTLLDMGAAIKTENSQDMAGEPVGDLKVTAGGLKGVAVPSERVPKMIDEFPILAVAAACADGTTTMTGLAELRVKESDRLAVMAKGLTACGVDLEEGEDSLIIHGNGKPPQGLQGTAAIATEWDHRIAMAFLVLGLVTDQPVRIDDSAPIATSFPEFTDLMTGIGADIGAAP